MDLHLSIYQSIIFILLLVLFYVFMIYIYITTDNDCKCINEKMPGLCCKVHESYAYFTVCAVICGIKSMFLRKKRTYLESSSLSKGTKICQRVLPVLQYVHVVEYNFCDSEYMITSGSLLNYCDTEITS